MRVEIFGALSFISENNNFKISKTKTENDTFLIIGKPFVCEKLVFVLSPNVIIVKKFKKSKIIKIGNRFFSIKIDDGIISLRNRNLEEIRKNFNLKISKKNYWLDDTDTTDFCPCPKCGGNIIQLEMQITHRCFVEIRFEEKKIIEQDPYSQEALLEKIEFGEGKFYCYYCKKQIPKEYIKFISKIDINNIPII